MSEIKKMYVVLNDQGKAISRPFRTLEEANDCIVSSELACQLEESLPDKITE